MLRQPVTNDTNSSTFVNTTVSRNTRRRVVWVEYSIEAAIATQAIVMSIYFLPLSDDSSWAFVLAQAYKVQWRVLCLALYQLLHRWLGIGP